MRIRKIVRTPKIIRADTKWRSDEMPPRLSGIYVKTMPARPHWQWRSTLATSEGYEYILLCQVNQSRDNWLAWLIRKVDGGGSLVSRYETHGSHPGLHVHAHCERGAVETGPAGLDGLLRIPGANCRPGRPMPTRLDLFWKNACAHYRLDYEKGDLL